MLGSLNYRFHILRKKNKFKYWKKTPVKKYPMLLTFPCVHGPPATNSQLVAKPYCILITSQSMVGYGWQMVSHASKITSLVSLLAVFPGWGLTKLLISSGETGLTAASHSIACSQGRLPPEAICPFLHAGLLIRLTVPELTSAKVLTNLCTELVIALEGFMGLCPTRCECTGRAKQFTWAWRTWWSNFLGLQCNSDIRVRGYHTGLQYHEGMCQSAHKPTVLFLLLPGIKRPPNGGSRSQDETNGRWQFFRQEAAGVWGLKGMFGETHSWLKSRETTQA